MIRKMRSFIILCALAALTAVAGCSAPTAESAPADVKEEAEQVQDKEDQEEFAKKKKKKKAEKEDAEDAKDDNGSSDEIHEAFEKYLRTELSMDTASRDVDFVTKWNEEGYYSDDTPLELFGVVDHYFGDFDGDGDEEMLVICTSADDVYENLQLRMFEYKYGKVELSEFFTFGEDIFHADENDSYVFIYDHDGKPAFGIMLTECYYLTADGLNLDFVSERYDGEEFHIISGADYIGSDMEEDGGFASALKKAGINMKWEDVYGDNAQSKILAASGGSLLAEIRTETVKTDDEGYMPVKLYKHTMITSYPENASVSGGKKKDSKKLSKDWTSFGKEDAAEESESNSDSEYIFPDSSERLLTEADLRGLSNEQLRRARNEIAARHGRKFTDESLREYFESKSWYEGTIEPDDFNKKVQLNKTELENMDFIKKHEK